jgi:hypothetical protein
MFIRLLLILLLGEIFSAALQPTLLDSTIEIDLVFPLNETYAPVDSFPVIFVLQNISVAWNFGFQFLWNITGVPDDEGAGQEIFGPGSVMVFHDEDLPVPSDPYIVANSTNFHSSIVPNVPLSPGNWVLGKCSISQSLISYSTCFASYYFLIMSWEYTAH